MLGVSPSMSFRGIDPYKLYTSRLQNPSTNSLSISEIKSINSSVFFRWAGTCRKSTCRDLDKYLDNLVTGVSVAACMGLPFSSPSLWSFGKQ